MDEAEDDVVDRELDAPEKQPLLVTLEEFARLAREYEVEVSIARAVVDDDPGSRHHVFFDLLDLEALAGWRQSPRCLRCGSRASRRVPAAVRCDVCGLERYAPVSPTREAGERWREVYGNAVVWPSERKERWARYVAAERWARLREVDAYILARRLGRRPVPAWARALRRALTAAQKHAPEKPPKPMGTIERWRSAGLLQGR